ncbi:phosphopantetheine-binding protein [Paenibacillus graminis]|uniref:phosphopantetheine-binding protein n=1 Tax=Paenibacillus graminis TaxID=189425 RepID=UPI000F9A0A2B|nr:phosphopantetheine-binding protein [Paenibacillus graminis]MEC0168774.1 phosphopantetheine-binding protein [Paenibacillus graminis]
MITKNEIEAQLVQIYLKQMQAVATGDTAVQTNGIDFSGDQISLQDAGINSLGFIRLVVEIENAFQMQFEDDMLNIELFHSLQDLVAYIEREVNKAS